MSRPSTIVRRVAFAVLPGLLLVPAFLFAVPHTFANGQVADAVKVNENFQSLETRSTVRWQKKTMSANVSTQGVRTELNFSNLDTTKTYRLSISTQCFANGHGGLVYSHNGSEILRAITHPGTYDGTVGNSVIFQATTTTLVATVFTTGGCIVSANTTFAILEELPGHQAVTAF